MTEVLVKYTCATSEVDIEEPLKGIIYDADFEDGRVTVEAAFARGLTHPQLYLKKTDYPEINVPVTGGAPEFDSIAVYSHHDFGREPEVYAFGVAGDRELRGSENPDRVRRLGVALGAVSYLLVDISEHWVMGERHFSAEELDELTAHIKFY